MGQCARLKSKLLELFSLEPVPEVPQNHVNFVDMGLIWRLATPTPEDREDRNRDGSDYCWIDYLHKMCAVIFSSHANAYCIILINDIKDDEHDRRAAKYPYVPNIFPKPEDRFPGPAEFSELMVNSGSKVRAENTSWSSAG